MYAIPNKTQHKLIAKVRGGISQNLDSFTSSNFNNATNNNTNSSSRSSSSSFSAASAKSSITSPFSSAPSIKESSLARSIDEGGFNAELNHLPQPIFHSRPEKGGNKSKSASHYRGSKQSITPEHNEMIRYVQQTWKGVEMDYKKSVNSYINKIDIKNSAHDLKQSNAKKKTATTSTPLLLSGSYHHTTRSSGQKPDLFQPFDLEAFWGNRILKRITEEL